MPIQQIAVVAPSGKMMDTSGTAVSENERGDVERGSCENQSGVRSITDCDKRIALDCDTDAVVTQNEVTGVTNANTHVVADTVIIGDLNSDSLSDDTGRQSDIGADGHVHVHVVRPGTGTDGNRGTDISNSGNVTCNDKRSQSRNTGKSSKKEKPTPVKKKDSGTQV